MLLGIQLKVCKANGLHSQKRGWKFSPACFLSIVCPVSGLVSGQGRLVIQGHMAKSIYFVLLMLNCLLVAPLFKNLCSIASVLIILDCKVRIKSFLKPQYVLYEPADSLRQLS